MKQIFNKLVKQKTKINRQIGKNHYKTEENEGEIKKFIREKKFFKTAIRNRKNKNKTSKYIFLRISEIKNSTLHYKNDIIVLKDKILKFENLKISF